jgi:hypothetical protein
MSRRPGRAHNDGLKKGSIVVLLVLFIGSSACSESRDENPVIPTKPAPAAVDAATGQITTVTSSCEVAWGITPSPSWTSFSVTGQSLLVYTEDGRLLGDLGGPPDGYRYGEVAWSPDGSSLAIIAVPEGAPLAFP